jgi:hypothetical protein
MMIITIITRISLCSALGTNDKPNNDDDDDDNSIQFCIISVVHQQPDDQLQTQHKTSAKNIDKKNKTMPT